MADSDPEAGCVRTVRQSGMYFPAHKKQLQDPSASLKPLIGQKIRGKKQSPLQRLSAVLFIGAGAIRITRVGSAKTGSGGPSCPGTLRE